MALTYFVYAREGHRVIGHSGSQKAFQCFFLADSATGVAAVAGFNSAALREVDGRGTRAMMIAWMERMLDEVFPQFRR